MERPKFDIYFMLNGKTYAFKAWHGVPRVGDWVMFHPKDGPVQYKVINVVWGVAPNDHTINTVNVHLSAKEKWK